jgi:hypothetical protein
VPKILRSARICLRSAGLSENNGGMSAEYFACQKKATKE